MLTRKDEGHLPMTHIVKDKIVRLLAENESQWETGSLSIRTSQLFHTSRRLVKNGSAPKNPICELHSCHNPLGGLAGRNLPFRQGPQRAVFFCLVVAKNSIWHLAISLKNSSYCLSTARARPMASKPVSDLPPWSSTVPLPPLLTHTHPGQTQGRYTPLLLYHVGAMLVCFWRHLL